MNTELHDHRSTDDRRSIPSRPLSDPELSSLLRSLPHEQASIGFEERVKRRLGERPARSSASRLSRSARLAAPLIAAAVLGFLVGPDVFRHGSDPVSTSPDVTAAQADSEQMQPMDPPRSLALDPSRAIPSVGASARAQPVSSVAPGAGSAGMSIPGNRLQQFQREAARIRQQLDELRRQQNEATPRVLWTTEEGVEVEIDLVEFLMMVEQANAAMEASGSGADRGVASSERPTILDPKPSGAQPPRW